MQSIAEALSDGSKASIGINQSENSEKDTKDEVFFMTRDYTFRDLWVPFVLFGEDVVERPWLEFSDVTQLSRLPEIFLGILSCNKINMRNPA